MTNKEAMKFYLEMVEKYRNVLHQMEVYGLNETQIIYNKFISNLIDLPELEVTTPSQELNRMIAKFYETKIN